MFKLILLAAVAYLVYVVFFKKNAFLNSKNSKKETHRIDEMIACAHCSTYVSYDEAIFSSGKYYCSQTCINEDL